MTRQELTQIHARFFKSPGAISMFEDPNKYLKNMQNKKYHNRPGTVVWSEGTFRGNLKRTFNY